MSKNIKLNETEYSGVSTVQLPTTDGGTASFKDTDEIVTPSGTKTITENGTFDVTNFASALVNVASGGSSEALYRTEGGILYTPNERIVKNGASINSDAITPQYYNATELLTFETDLVGNGYQFSSKVFFGCSKLKSVVFSKLGQIVTPIKLFNGCSSLETVQFGSIGYPMTKLSDGRMMDGFSGAIELTIYVDAETLADIPTEISSHAPWNNSNATIIYRNSTTGNVIES